MDQLQGQPQEGQPQTQPRARVFTGCACLPVLVQNLYVCSGTVIPWPPSPTEPATRHAPILRQLKEGPLSGRLSVTSNWIEVHFCPHCGAKVEYKDEAPNEAPPKEAPNA